MSYESEVLAPLPPLCEVNVGKDIASGDKSAGGAVGAHATGKVQAKVMESSSTRAGGSDLGPALNPVREVRVDREPDVRQVRDDGCCLIGRGRRAFIPVLVWMALGLFGVWIYCQLVPLVTFAISCRGWRMYAALLVLSVPIAVIALIAMYVFRIFRKLPVFEQVTNDAEKSYEIKEKLLHGYVEKLPATSVYVKSAGFKKTRIDELAGILERLNGNGVHYSDELGWIDDFNRFQAIQRERANEIIGRYCKLIGLKTAACPWRVVDVICVFMNSTLMVAELAKIYNRRVDRQSAFRLVVRWFVNIYISGELEQITESAVGEIGEHLQGSVKESFSELGWLDGDWAGTVAQSMPFLTKFAGKVVEGGVNAYLAFRMGRKSIAAFEPLVY